MVVSTLFLNMNNSFFPGAPTLEATPLEPLLAVAGDAVLIDCVVKNLANYTVSTNF